jgi:predicted molibdopterin-dependent oxidoreductase YjgC
MQPETIPIKIDGQEYQVRAGTSVAVALVRSLGPAFRKSATGERRGPLCGMGVCFECRATVDGREQRATCQIFCRAGMDVRTDLGTPRDVEDLSHATAR